MDRILPKYFEKGITYQQLLHDLKEFIANGNSRNNSKEDEEKYRFSKLNFHRFNRIQKTYLVQETVKEIIGKINWQQNWLVLTEHWCGDSAQILPVLNKLVEINSNIQMKFLYRDENINLMNLYLTDSKQAIPKIIGFTPSGNQLFSWGPRPKEAVELFAKEREQGLPKEEILNKLHLWYGRDRGKTIETEFMELLQKLT